MNAGKERPGTSRRPESPSAVSAEFRRLGARLLRALAEPGCWATRRGETIQIMKSRAGVTLAAGSMPSAALIELVSSGAVACQSRGGETRYCITQEGRAAIFRSAGGGDAFADQHREIATRPLDVEGERHELRINLREDVLEALARIRTRNGAALIGPAAIEAGRRLARDIAMAGILPKVTANWDRLVVDGATPRGLSPGEARLAAQQRVNAALAAATSDFSGILLDLCGFSKGIETIEQERDLPARSGKIAAMYALNALARHYGLAEAIKGKSRQPIRQSGTPDYRPQLRKTGS